MGQQQGQETSVAHKPPEGRVWLFLVAVPRWHANQ
jgi:hypothetical protein